MAQKPSTPKLPGLKPPDPNPQAPKPQVREVAERSGEWRALKPPFERLPMESKRPQDMPSTGEALGDRVGVLIGPCFSFGSGSVLPSVLQGSAGS